jgi:hypothetical protein
VSAEVQFHNRPAGGGALTFNQGGGNAARHAEAAAAARAAAEARAQGRSHPPTERELREVLVGDGRAAGVDSHGP